MSKNIFKKSRNSFHDFFVCVQVRVFLHKNLIRGMSSAEPLITHNYSNEWTEWNLTKQKMICLKNSLMVYIK